LPGGRIEVGESASTAVIREVAEESSVAITVTDLAGVYSDPDHVLTTPGRRAFTNNSRCASTLYAPPATPTPITRKPPAAAWFDPKQATQLSMHPAMRQRTSPAPAGALRLASHSRRPPNPVTTTSTAGQDQGNGAGAASDSANGGLEVHALRVPYRTATHGLSRLITVSRNCCSLALSWAYHVVPKL